MTLKIESGHNKNILKYDLVTGAKFLTRITKRRPLEEEKSFSREFLIITANISEIAKIYLSV